MIFRAFFLSLQLMQMRDVSLELPSCPLIEKSTEIISPLAYQAMGQSEDEKVAALTRKIFVAYKDNGLASTTVVQKEFFNQVTPFQLTLIPFSDTKSALIQQLQVLKSIVWEPFCPPEEKLILQANELLPHLEEQALSEEAATEGEGTDVFCRKEVLEKQTLYEGRTVRLLYPTSVLPTEEPASHFLIVPKICRPDYLSLTAEEALEIEALSRKIFRHFMQEGYLIGYGLHKNGSVGVTVPDFHKHLIFFKSTEDENSALYKMIKNVLFGSSALSKEQYDKNFAYFKSTLNL